jgi:hypothetical protein
MLLLRFEEELDQAILEVYDLLERSQRTKEEELRLKRLGDLIYDFEMARARDAARDCLLSK